ncbi:MAG TPA: hypothetical protein HPP81_01400 [Deltaproteobacteria bacterium]|jgi:hypothetical protein|nr:hypothetical protein [Deltaproteobacteria bacterium]
MKFPEWAPKELCELYLKYEKDGWHMPEEGEDGDYEGLAGVDGGELKELLERMLTDEDMEPVWRAWSDLYPEGMDSGMEGTVLSSLFLFDCVLQVLMNPHSLVTRKEEIQKLEEIAKLAKRLSLAIKQDSMFSVTCLFGLFVRDKMSKIKTMTKIAEELNAALGPDYILKRMAKEALFYAEAIKKNDFEDDHLYRYVSRQRADKAPANHFIRAMSEVFERHFDSTRPRLLARLTRVVLDDPGIDETFVKTSLQEWRKSKAYQS